MQVVIRALSVLKLLARSPKGLTLGEISERLELPVASAHRTAAVLEKERFITRSSSNRRYFLGPAARELAQADFPRESPLVTAHRAVADASRRTGETVFLSGFAGDKVVCLALSESSFPLRLFVRVGQTMPLHAAAAARALLAWQPAEKIRKLLADAQLTAYTPETPHTVNAVLDHLAGVREAGYDVCESELDEYVWAVAAPVRSSTDEVVASITLAAPSHRMADEVARRKATDIILAAAHEMSADLGWVPQAS
jgi:DNA-binding IclR family transcriptional regulator